MRSLPSLDSGRDRLRYGSVDELVEVATLSRRRLRVRVPSGLWNYKKEGDDIWMLIIIMILDDPR